MKYETSSHPREWSTVRFKAYPRYLKISLPEPFYTKSILLRSAFIKRQSSRDFLKKPLSLKEISNILFFSCGLLRGPESDLNATRRMQPSGGGLYPLEIYPIVLLGNTTLPRGIYHYNVLEHHLERLPDVFQSERIFFPPGRKASIVFLITFIEERVMSKYGNLSYKLALLEAGHIGQNIYLNCAAMNLKCCALAQVDDEATHRLLDIDGISETAIYAVAVGR